jgi:hypothetical protein
MMGNSARRHATAEDLLGGREARTASTTGQRHTPAETRHRSTWRRLVNPNDI